MARGAGIGLAAFRSGPARSGGLGALGERLAAVGAELAAAAVLGVLAAQALWTLAAPATGTGGLATERGAAPQAAPARAVDLSVLTEADMFRADGTATVAEIEPAAAPETDLNLRLTYARVGLGGRAGAAGIVVGGGASRAFAEGDEVQPGVRIAQILRDRVILDRGGVREALLLPGAEDRVFAPVEAPAETARTVADAAPDAPVVLGDLDPQALLDALRPRPVRRDGVVYGFAIDAPGREALLADVGLAPGDVLIAVEGVRLADQGDVFALLQDLEGASRVELVVERGGAELTRVVTFDD